MNQHGKKPSPYDITPQELFYAELGREISAYAENNKTTSLRFSRKIFEKDRKGNPEDDVWNHMLSASDKLTRIGTLWGPQDTSCLSEKEKVIVRAQLRKRDNDRKRIERRKQSS
tara:strand:- start:3695 stop:4036 length:342 start_codon:yes stop_codon:yes gene_type:complete